MMMIFISSKVVRKGWIIDVDHTQVVLFFPVFGLHDFLFDPPKDIFLYGMLCISEVGAGK